MWLYEKEPFEDPQDYYGFVYQITNLTNNRKYIGRKFFTKSKTKQVKGKKRKSRITSDWNMYWGSSAELLNDVALLGEENFRRDILRLCKTRTECSYYETKYILEVDALLKLEYYNSWCSCKIRKDHLKHLQQQ
jgi:hypothetical protein